MAAIWERKRNIAWPPESSRSDGRHASWWGYEGIFFVLMCLFVVFFPSAPTHVCVHRRDISLQCFSSSIFNIINHSTKGDHFQTVLTRWRLFKLATSQLPSECDSCLLSHAVHRFRSTNTRSPDESCQGRRVGAGASRGRSNHFNLVIDSSSDKTTRA